MANISITMPAHYRAWQMEVLSAIPAKRLSLIVAHRRAGKTEVVATRLIMAALTLNRLHPTPFYGYLAPFLNQAKAVAWNRLKYYARLLPNTKINESELLITLFNGSQIKLFGADYPDRLRGLGFDGVVMDEVAQMRPETWGAVVRPCLADREGWAVFIGTPKGRNQFYDLYAESLNDPEKWFCGVFPADKTGVLPQSELDSLHREIGDNLFRQEFLCDFTAANEDCFIDFELVRAATIDYKERAARAAGPLIFGLDPARFGDDRTALIRRVGMAVLKIESWQGIDLMQTAAKVAVAIEQERPAAIFIDSVGLGAGVVDRLRQLGYRVTPVNSGARPSQPDIYYNLKAEMWAKMRQWMQEGGTLPDDLKLRADLLGPHYEYDAVNRLKIESKESLKSRGLASPDYADALALTFALPVADPVLRGRRPKFAEMD